MNGKSNNSTILHFMITRRNAIKQRAIKVITSLDMLGFFVHSKIQQYSLTTSK